MQVSRSRSSNASTLARGVGRRAGDGAVLALYALSSTKRTPVSGRLLRAFLIRRQVRRAVKRAELRRKRARVDALLAAGVIGLAAGDALGRRRARSDAQS